MSSNSAILANASIALIIVLIILTIAVIPTSIAVLLRLFLRSQSTGFEHTTPRVPPLL